MKKTCSKCDKYNQGFPVLQPSGRPSPNDLICPVCQGLHNPIQHRVVKTEKPKQASGKDSGDPSGDKLKEKAKGVVTPKGTVKNPRVIPTRTKWEYLKTYKLLLKLAESPNPHEASLALEKAHYIYEKHLQGVKYHLNSKQTGRSAESYLRECESLCAVICEPCLCVNFKADAKREKKERMIKMWAKR